MRRILILACLVFALGNFRTNGQSLWKLELNFGTFSLLQTDTSFASLKTWFESSPPSPWLPALFLAYYYGHTEQEYILSKLQTYHADTLNESFRWSTYYEYQRIRGYLGDQDAIAGMDTVIQYSDDKSNKIAAIRLLAQIGRLDYYDKLISLLGDRQSQIEGWPALVLYGNTSQFSDRVKSYFQAIVQNSQQSQGTRSIAAGYLAEIDTVFTVELLNNLFYSTTGKLRNDYFNDLSSLDPENAAARSMHAIPQEPDEHLRGDYIPFYKGIVDAWEPASYLQPSFIKFVQDWIQNEPRSSIVHVVGSILIDEFVPLKPSSLSTILVLLDSLISTTSQVASFNWLGNAAFVTELDGDLQSARSSLVTGDSVNCALQVKAFQSKVDAEYKDSLDGDNKTVTVEGWKFLYYNAQYILDRLPAPPSISTYSLFATHSMHLEQNSDVYSGDIGVNAAGSPPFLDSQVELSVGISTTTPAGYAVKANQIKVKSGSTVNSNVYYNELDNNGTITGSQNTPLQLPLVATLPEFKSATPGAQNFDIPQNGTLTLQPGSYGDIMVRKNGVLTLTGGTYHFNLFTTGDDVQLIFQAPSEVRIAGKFDSGQGSYIGPQDTTTMTADQIIFYVGGINGTNGNLGATPKAAKIGIGNTVWASFYVPNGTLWIRQNSQAKGQFIGKDVDVGVGVKIRR